MAVQYAFGQITTQGLNLSLDAADTLSYPGSGTTWTDLITRSITGSLNQCSFTSDFKGGIVFNNTSASVVVSSSVGNFGTNVFTVEMAFRPSQINGRHYLMSKNSGSFPNWAIYISGSSNTGKLWAEYNISSTISCSVSSSVNFTTSSNYFTDTVFSPLERKIYLNIQGNTDNSSIASNGSGSLSSTSSLFLGNTSFSSSFNYLGSLFSVKLYNTFTSGYNNYKTINNRFQTPTPPRPSNATVLIVGGGGGGGGALGNPGYGGGGAGGAIITNISLTPGTYSVFVGDGGRSGTSGGGVNGQTSSFAGNIALGGGGGGVYYNVVGKNGASGGGGGANNGGSEVTVGGTGSLGQGFPGGSGSGYDGLGGGGGGGFSSPGINGALGGHGGTGFFTSPFSSVAGSPAGWFSGGGGGGNWQTVGYITPYNGTGGLGGGGNGSQSGSANTGGGGGGGFPGGSGIVAIRYSGPPIATGGNILSAGGDTIHTFTTTGSHTFTIF